MSEGKVMTSFTQAVADVGDGSVLIVGGFGLSGCPEHAIAALREAGAEGSRRRQQQLRCR